MIHGIVQIKQRRHVRKERTNRNCHKTVSTSEIFAVPFELSIKPTQATSSEAVYNLPQYFHASEKVKFPSKIHIKSLDFLNDQQSYAGIT